VLSYAQILAKPTPEIVPPSNASSQDERQQKLNLLANLKEAVVQLEAEIAIMFILPRPGGSAPRAPCFH